MGLKAGLDRCGESRPHRDSIPNRPARRQSLYRLRYPAYNDYVGTHKTTLIITSLEEMYLNSMKFLIINLRFRFSCIFCDIGLPKLFYYWILRAPIKVQSSVRCRAVSLIQITFVLKCRFFFFKC